LRLDHWRIPDGVEREIPPDSGKVDKDVSDDIGLIGWWADDSMSSGLENASGED
jgi:hypothetical protein